MALTNLPTLITHYNSHATFCYYSSNRQQAHWQPKSTWPIWPPLSTNPDTKRFHPVHEVVSLSQHPVSLGHGFVLTAFCHRCTDHTRDRLVRGWCRNTLRWSSLTDGSWWHSVYRWAVLSRVTGDTSTSCHPLQSVVTYLFNSDNGVDPECGLMSRPAENEQGIPASDVSEITQGSERWRMTIIDNIIDKPATVHSWSKAIWLCFILRSKLTNWMSEQPTAAMRACGYVCVVTCWLPIATVF